jgi:hypothetical protein
MSQQKIDIQREFVVFLPVLLDEFNNPNKVGVNSKNAILLKPEDSEISFDILVTYLEKNKIPVNLDEIEFLGVFDLNLDFLSKTENIFHFYSMTTKNEDYFKNIDLINISEIKNYNDILLKSIFLTFYENFFKQN